MEFLTLSQLELNKAKYLISKESKKPVTNAAFVAAQQAADYTVRLAEAIKGKKFTADKLDNLEAIKAELRAAIAAKAVKEHVSAPTKPVSKVNDEMVQFALDFANFKTEESKVAKLNEIMAEFDAIDDVESNGDYFSEGLVKLNKIYTTAEVLAAVKATAEVLK